MTDETEEIELDQRAAVLTFDALERAVCWAVDADEMQVAAEYVETLLIHASQLDDWHTEYMDESEALTMESPEIAAQQNEVIEAIHAVRDWAHEHDHPVAGWFDDGEGAEDGGRDD